MPDGRKTGCVLEGPNRPKSESVENCVFPDNFVGMGGAVLGFACGESGIWEVEVVREDKRKGVTSQCCITDDMTI